MSRLFAVGFALTLLLVGKPAVAGTVRYFAVWSYAQNAPAEEIQEHELPGRKLGYWALELDEEGRVLAGTYHGSSGAVWLRLEYVAEHERIYADLYAPSGVRLARKSTQLETLVPHWGD